MTSNPKKCANVACGCAAEEGSDYCSARCEEMGGLTVTKCPCGHAECVATAGAGAGSMPIGAR